MRRGSIGVMIKSFKGKEAEKIRQGRYSKRITKDIQLSTVKMS